jgi:hypothetical protein
MDYRKHLSKERVINTDQYCFMKPITKHDHFRLQVFTRISLFPGLKGEAIGKEIGAFKLRVAIWKLTKNISNDKAVFCNYRLKFFSSVPNFHILCCGGDGTAGWVLASLGKLSKCKNAFGLDTLHVH